MTRETDILVRSKPGRSSPTSGGPICSSRSTSTPSRTSGARGSRPFYLNFSSDPGSTRRRPGKTPRRRRRSANGQDPQKIVQNSKILESRDLAQRIQGSLVGFLQPPVVRTSRTSGRKAARFWTLHRLRDALGPGRGLGTFRTQMEAQRLRSEAYRQQNRPRVYDGLLAYVQSLGKDDAMDRRGFLKDLAPGAGAGLAPKILEARPRAERLRTWPTSRAIRPRRSPRPRSRRSAAWASRVPGATRS